MKVLFLNGPFKKLPFSRASRSPAVTKSGTLYYPIFLSYAAGLVDRDGDCDVRMVDAVAQKMDQADLVDSLRSDPPDLVFCETSTPSISEDIKTAGALKDAFPACKMVMVGTHASSLPQLVLDADHRIDAVARGEYDQTTLDITNALQSDQPFSGIAGITYRNNGQVAHTPDRSLIEDLDSLPFVSQVYHKFLKPRDYFFSAARYPMVMIMTTRGCPFKCNWCLYPQVAHGERYRKRSPENVAAEFTYIAGQMPQVKEIGIEDDLFTADLKWLRKTCQLLIDQNNPIPFWVDTRITLGYDDMCLMKRAGCRLLIAGFESADQHILDNIQKGTKADQAYLFSANAQKAGLIVHGCFVFGQPGETPQTLRNTLEYAKDLNPDTAQFFPMICYPGTRSYNQAKEQNILRSENYDDWLTDEGGHNATVDLPGLPGEEVVRFCNQARREYYLRKRYIFKKLRQSVTNIHEARRNFKAFKRLARFLVKTP